MTGSIVRLKDAEGNIINIPAFKGKDGISPLLRKSDTAIEVSYDGGATYTELVPLSELKIYIYDGPGENDISLGLSNAAVGDIIKVKAVDDNGTPTAWESVAMPDNEENWVLLGEYDCSLAENQVEIIKINKYNGLPFTAKKMFVYGRNVKVSASYAEIGTNKGVFQWGYTGNHTYAYLFPFNNGTYQLGETSNTYWTAVSIASQGQPFTETPFFPASEIVIKGRYCNFTGGTIKVWAVIEQ